VSATTALLCIESATAAKASVLETLSTNPPDPAVFPRPASGHQLPPAHTEVVGPKATNKFWSNWVVAPGIHEPIYPMPYVLKWGSKAGEPPELQVSHGEPRHVYGDAATNGPQRVRYYATPFICEFGLGAAEPSGPEGHIVVQEGIFGIRAEMRGPAASGRKIAYPIFSGMAYISGRYTGGFTPRITTGRALVGVERIRSGVWRFLNNGGVEFRVYALRTSGEFVDDSFEFDTNGLMNRPLEGWLRLAHVIEAGDVAVLDAHAGAILVDWQLEVEMGGLVRYAFAKQGAAQTELLHFAYGHHLELFTAVGGPTRAQALALSRAPTKGLMTGVVGDAWLLQVDTAQAKSLAFLPEGEPKASRVEFLTREALGVADWFGINWRATMLKGSYYFSGKGFQKVAMVCLLLEKFIGAADWRTQACAGLLAQGFRCLYDPTKAGDCAGAPAGSYYDEQWGGIPSKEGFHDAGCFGGADFGNACYNDHHYHFGYFVVSAAVLAKLVPSVLGDHKFVLYVETLIRDTTNPSRQDPFFPMFRSFDWFDLHSWSRGVVPSADGKDQESTSEELNLLYGIHLWGSLVGKPALQELGDTMLALCAFTVREFFLMEAGNPHHHEDFVKNHVTGIFFQNKVDYTTWFGWREEYIHGIQMLPLSPALQLTRKATFCSQEWDDVLSELPLSSTDPWTSILLTGTLAIIDPEKAYAKILQMYPENMDDGLTRAWALYWAAVQPFAIAPTETPTTSSTVSPKTSLMTTTSTLAPVASTETPMTSLAVSPTASLTTTTSTLALSSTTFVGTASNATTIGASTMLEDAEDDDSDQGVISGLAWALSVLAVVGFAVLFWWRLGWAKRHRLVTAIPLQIANCWRFGSTEVGPVSSTAHWQPSAKSDARAFGFSSAVTAQRVPSNAAAHLGKVGSPSASPGPRTLPEPTAPYV